MTDAATPPSATGRLSWALGFLGWIPVPFVSLIIAAIAMIGAYSAGRRSASPVAVGNARHAANWGLTILAVMVALALYVVVIAVGFPEFRQGFFPIGFAVIGFVVLSIVHAIVTIVGTITATRGAVLNPRVAIPFLRARP